MKRNECYLIIPDPSKYWLKLLPAIIRGGLQLALELSVAFIFVSTITAGLLFEGGRLIFEEIRYIIMYRVNNNGKIVNM